jgi:protein SCO1/2
MRRLLLWALTGLGLAAATLVVALSFGGSRMLAGSAGVSSASVMLQNLELPGPPITSLRGTLVDSEGQSRAVGELAGRPFIAAAIYTRCPTVCPMIVADLQRLERSASPGDSLRFVLFSLDPAHDTPERWRAFAAEHRLAAARWTLLTPDSILLAPLLHSLGVGSTRQSDGSFTHSSIVVLADRDGRIRDRQGALDSEPHALLAAWRAMRKRT